MVLEDVLLALRAEPPAGAKRARSPSDGRVALLSVCLAAGGRRRGRRSPARRSPGRRRGARGSGSAPGRGGERGAVAEARPDPERARGRAPGARRCCATQRPRLALVARLADPRGQLQRRPRRAQRCGRGGRDGRPAARAMAEARRGPSTLEACSPPTRPVNAGRASIARRADAFALRPAVTVALGDRGARRDLGQGHGPVGARAGLPVGGAGRRGAAPTARSPPAGCRPPMPAPIAWRSSRSRGRRRGEELRRAAFDRARGRASSPSSPTATGWRPTRSSARRAASAGPRRRRLHRRGRDRRVRPPSTGRWRSPTGAPTWRPPRPTRGAWRWSGASRWRERSMRARAGPGRS